MQAMVAVVEDLYSFVFYYGLGFYRPLKVEPTLLPPGSPAETTVDASTTTATPARPSYESIKAHAADPVAAGDIQYVRVPQAHVYALPTRTFDGAFSTLQYGASVPVVSQQGSWLSVLIDEKRGWIQRDSVTDKHSALYPQLEVGKTYDADHDATERIRLIIDDSFTSSGLDTPLQNVEYVTYRLLRKGRSVLWPSERPRLAGTWQRLLRGVTGVHVGVHPKTGSIIEYVNPDDTGHVGYVASVYPDDSITINEVGYPTDGVYSERTLKKDEWRELRPVFIEVT